MNAHDSDSTLSDDVLTDVDGGWHVELVDGRVFHGPGKLQPGDLERAMKTAGYAE